MKYYSMTYDASHKVGRIGGHVTTFARHLARDSDEAAGFNFGHSNPHIDHERTHLNKSFVNDGEGGFRSLRSVDGKPPSDELSRYLDQRLATVMRPLRKDAILIRGLVLQLDPKWFEEHNPDWRENGLNAAGSKFMNVAREWAADEFGQENLIGGSLHLDEHSPQLQLAITPITADGRLSQKDYFRGPADFKRQHRDLRSRMEAAGYDVEHAVSERSREHLSSTDFADLAARAERMTRDANAEWRGAQTERAHASDARREAQQAREEASDQAARHASAAARLVALGDEIAAALHAAGPMPRPPDYEGLKRDILDCQSAVAMRFIRSFPPLADGSTLGQRFERFARTEFARFVRQRVDSFGGYRGPDFVDWQRQTLAARQRLARAQALDDITPARARYLDRSFGD